LPDQGSSPISPRNGGRSTSSQGILPAPSGRTSDCARWRRRLLSELAFRGLFWVTGASSRDLVHERLDCLFQGCVIVEIHLVSDDHVSCLEMVQRGNGNGIAPCRDDPGEKGVPHVILHGKE